MAKRILVCDDAAFMRMMIKDILTKNGYEIAGEAENGAVAVNVFSYGPAGYGYRIHTVRSQGLYC